jgi:hypothetical protein
MDSSVAASSSAADNGHRPDRSLQEDLNDLMGHYVAFVPEQPDLYGISLTQPFIVGKVSGVQSLSESSQDACGGILRLEMWYIEASDGKDTHLNLHRSKIPQPVNELVKQTRRLPTAEEQSTALADQGGPLHYVNGSDWYWHPKNSPLAKIAGSLPVNGMNKRTGRYVSETGLRSLLTRTAGNLAFSQTTSGYYVSELLRGTRSSDEVKVVISGGESDAD